jgi:FecR-like protein
MIQFLRIASRSAVLTLVAALITCVTQSAMAATTAARGDIVVVTVHGTVNATMAGMTVPLSAGAILQLPATVRTGADGAVELRQGSSTFAAAGNTELEIPQSAAEDGLVERIVQIRGNAFYSIGKRTGTRLRVEAPYLVAVIKGTQFNVAAQEDSTTIALFEGHLEVRASDESDVIDLDAGEIAIRRRDDISITVLRLNAAARDARRNQELAARPQADSARPTSDALAARNDDTASRPRVDTTVPTDDAPRGDDVSVTPPTERERIVDALPDRTELAAKTALAVDLPAGSVDLNTGVTAEVGEVARVDTGVSAGVDLGSGTATAAADVGVNVARVSTDVGAGANVDIPAGAASVDVGASAAVGEVASVGTSVSTAVDAPAGTVDVGAGATVAAGATPVADVGATAAVDTSAGTVAVGADTSVAGTDVGANVGVDASAGNVGTDVAVGGANVGVNVGSGGLEVDLGLGGVLGRKHRN